jgi:hypothetical protein
MALPVPSMCTELPDAKLMELGRRFRELLPAEIAARNEVARLVDVIDERLDNSIPTRTSSQEEFRQFNAAWHRISHEVGHHEASRAWNAANEELNDLADAVMAAEATTLKALALKAEVCAWQATSVFADGTLDWDQSQVYSLTLSVFRAAGEPVPEFIQEIAHQDWWAEADEEVEA